MSDPQQRLPALRSKSVHLTQAAAVSGVAVALPAGVVLVGMSFWHDLDEWQQALLALFAFSLYVAILSGFYLLLIANRHAGSRPADENESDRTLPHQRRQLALPAPASMPVTGMEMIVSLMKRDPLSVLEAIETRPVSGLNDRDAVTGMTILHHAAAGKARAIVHALGARDDVDFTLTDAKGRTASALALEIADDHELSAYLLAREAEQLRAQGALPV